MIIKKNHNRKIAFYAFVLTCISLVFFSVYVFTVYQDLQKPGIVVLLFHKVIENDQEWSNKYQHKKSDFEEQLDYLIKNGYTTILPSEIQRFSQNSNDKKIVMLTFDDGTPDHYKIVYPLLRQRDYKGVFFVIAGNLNKPYGLSARQLREMSQNGMEIGSHSLSHPFLDEMEEKDIFYELDQSKKILSEAIGKEVTSFAPPGGWYNDLVIQMAKDVGYKALYSCEIGITEITEPVYIYKRIEVLGDMPLEEFIKLLSPHKILGYKMEQTLKHIIHWFIGSTYYRKLAEIS